MERIVVLIAAVVPAFFVLAYGMAKARGDWRNEALWSAFLLGAVGALVAAAGEVLILGPLLHWAALPVPFNAAADALVVAAIPEETIKFVVLVGIAERHVDVRRRQD